MAQLFKKTFGLQKATERLQKRKSPSEPIISAPTSVTKVLDTHVSKSGGIEYNVNTMDRKKQAGPATNSIFFCFLFVKKK